MALIIFILRRIRLHARLSQQERNLLCIFNGESGKTKGCFVFQTAQAPDNCGICIIIVSLNLVQAVSYCDSSSGVFNSVGTPTFSRIRAC